MAARRLLVYVCILMVGVPVGYAEPPRAAPGIRHETRHVVAASGVLNPPGAATSRRSIAVIDLNNDQAIRDVANRLLDLLASHAELAPPAISDGAALVDKLPPDDELRVAEAQKKRQSAELNLAQRNFREAAIDAVEGQELLLRVTPRAALAVYSDLALALGLSRLGEQKDDQAREAFALAHRLEPRRTLDDLHYLPEVVQTFEAAKQQGQGTGVIMVRGAGRVWIDGEEVGSAPGEFKASYGRHVVWLTGLLRETVGKEVVVSQTRPGDATILDGPLTRPQKVVRFRIVLSQAQDPAARASAMVALAAFVNVHEAVLLSMVDGKIHFQLWRDGEPGFGPIKQLGRDNPVEILKQLAPAAPVDDPPLVIIHAPIIERRWYERPSVQIGIMATLMAAVLGGYLWARHGEPDRAWHSDISGFGTGVSGTP